MVRADGGRLSERLAYQHRAPACGDGVGQLIGQIELPGQLFQQFGFVGLFQRASLLEGDGEKLGRLGVRTGARSGDARIAGVTPSSDDVPRALRVMGQYRRVDVAGRLICIDEPTM